MKKNNARYMLVVAVVFSLWPFAGYSDGDSTRIDALNEKEITAYSAIDELQNSQNFQRLGLDVSSDDVHAIYDSEEAEAGLSEAHMLLLDQAAEGITSLDEAAIYDEPPQQTNDQPLSVAATPEDAMAIYTSNVTPAPLSSTQTLSKDGSVSASLIGLMTQIESSLKTIESAVVASLPAPKSAGDSKAPVRASPDAPKPSTPDANPMPDDVILTVKELTISKALTDDTEITPTTGHEIRLNASMPLTGSMALVGRDYLTGIGLVFDKFNRAGGLDKKYLLKYSTIDDRYISTVAKDNVLKSLKDSPFFIGNFGSHLLTTIKDLVEKREALMLFPTAGDVEFRNKDYHYLINLRPSLEIELRALIKYAINNQHRKKIAVFYEDDAWGKAGLAAVGKILSEFSLTICAKGDYPSNTIDVMPATTDIIKSRPDAVICISTYRPTYNFIQLLLNEGFQQCLFLGLGPSTPMQQLLKKSRGVTIVTTSVVPDPAKSKMPIVEEYRKDMVKYFPLRELSQYSLEGYIAGAIFVSALKQLESPYTVSKLMTFFEGLSYKDFGGFKINFNPKTRELSSRVWINKGNPEDEWDDSFSR